MSPSAAPPSSNHHQRQPEHAPGVSGAWSVPGKAIVLGEYAVLCGAPALHVTLAPRFSILPAQGGSNGAHPESPAGRLLAFAERRGIAAPSWRFVDPLQGEGGFGASSAQFALFYRILAEQAGWELSAVGARRMYLEVLAGAGPLPSGADLVSQWSGGTVWFDPASERIESRDNSLNWGDLLVFSAAGQPGRKVPTHQHLAQFAGSSGLKPLLPVELERALRQILERLPEGRWDGAILGKAMSDYAQVLADFGLELPASRADREALSALPGVLGAKGTGALLADGIVVLLEPESSAEGSAQTRLRRQSVIRLAQARGLKLAADGITYQPGIQ